MRRSLRVIALLLAANAFLLYVPSFAAEPGRVLSADPDVQAAKDRLEVLLSSDAVKSGETAQALDEIMDRLDRTPLEKLSAQDRGILKGIVESAVSGDNPDVSQVLDDRLRQGLERGDGRLRPSEKEVLRLLNGKGESGAASEAQALMETVKALGTKLEGGGKGPSGKSRRPAASQGLEGLKGFLPDRPAPSDGAPTAIVDKGRGLFDNGRVAAVPDEDRQGIVFVAQGPSGGPEDLEAIDTGGTSRPPMRVTTDVSNMIQVPPPEPEPRKPSVDPVEFVKGWLKGAILASKPKETQAEVRPYARPESLPRRTPDGSLAARKTASATESDLRDAAAPLPAAPRTVRAFDKKGRLARRTTIQPDGSFESRAFGQYWFKGGPIGGSQQGRRGALDVLERGTTQGASLKISEAFVLEDAKPTRHQVLMRKGEMVIRVDADPLTGRPQNLKALIKSGYLSKEEARCMEAFAAPARSGGWFTPPTVSFKDGRPVLEAERRAPGGGVESYLSADGDDGWVVSVREPLGVRGSKERVEVWEGWTSDGEGGYGPAAKTVYERSTLEKGPKAAFTETEQRYELDSEGVMVKAEDRPEPAAQGNGSCKGRCRGMAKSKTGLAVGVAGVMPSVVSLGGPAGGDDEEDAEEIEPDLRSGLHSDPIAGPNGMEAVD